MDKNVIKTMKNINKAQIEKAQFNAYKIIKDLGHWHMDSRSAIEASGLPQNIYLEIKTNFLVCMFSSSSSSLTLL